MEKKLNLTLKKKWFDMIVSGEKKEEYREIKPSWVKKFGAWEDRTNGDYGFSNEPEIVHAFNGWAFSQKYPNIQWKHEGIRIGRPNPLWCEPEDINKDVFILMIGEIISKNPDLLSPTK